MLKSKCNYEFSQQGISTIFFSVIIGLKIADGTDLSFLLSAMPIFI